MVLYHHTNGQTSQNNKALKPSKRNTGINILNGNLKAQPQEIRKAFSVPYSGDNSRVLSRLFLCSQRDSQREFKNKITLLQITKYNKMNNYLKY